MAANDRFCENLVLLVGSNPLPNYLAAVALRAKHVHLLYTPQTVEPRDRLKKALETRSVAVDDSCIGDATDARAIRDACTTTKADHLHYSGGTKPMAANARMSFKGSDANCSYIDERKALLRFDDGAYCDLSTIDFNLSLDMLLDLHGSTRKPKKEREMGPSEADAAALAVAVLQDPGLATELYNHFKPVDDTGRPKTLPINKAKECAFTFELRVPTLSVSSVPLDDWTKAIYMPWLDFLCGTWLEAWTGSMIQQILGDTPKVMVGVNCLREEVEFEVDVAFLRGHRLYTISCTTHQSKTQCKSKLFEIAMRSRQMGGDLARCALVCLLDGDDSQGRPLIEQLRSDIESVWDAPNTPEVFGLADLREWAGIGQCSNTDRLREWLNK